MIKDKLFVICLPGNNFSGNFMVSLLNLVEFIRAEGGKYVVSNYFSSLVYASRGGCIEGDPLKGKNQLPFNGKNYDYMLWIDSDIRFTPQDFTKLVSHDKDICGGWYAQPSGESSLSEKEQHNLYVDGSKMAPQEVNAREELIEATTSGFGFMLIKQGVFEKIEYPWFGPKTFNLDGDIQYTEGEDGAFCRKAIEAGFKVYIDPKVKVGHEKIMVI